MGQNNVLIHLLQRYVHVTNFIIITMMVRLLNKICYPSFCCVMWPTLTPCFPSVTYWHGISNLAFCLVAGWDNSGLFENLCIFFKITEIIHYVCMKIRMLSWSFNKNKSLSVVRKVFYWKMKKDTIIVLVWVNLYKDLTVLFM